WCTGYHFEMVLLDSVDDWVAVAPAELRDGRSECFRLVAGLPNPEKDSRTQGLASREIVIIASPLVHRRQFPPSQYRGRQRRGRQRRRSWSWLAGSLVAI